MKRFFVCMLCLVLAVTPALAEQKVTPTPSAEGTDVEISLPKEGTTMDDVITAWQGLDANQDAYTILTKDEKKIAPETLFRLLATYCMQINAGTTWEHLADYEPEIKVEGEQIHATVMTHALGFVITLNAYTGECVELTVDREPANG